MWVRIFVPVLLFAFLPQPGRQTSPGGPALPAPTYPGVVQLMKDPNRALAALDGQTAGSTLAIEAMVLRAHLLSDVGRRQESAALWDKVADADEDLRPFAEQSAIAELLALKDVEQAAPRIRALVGSAPTSQDDLLLLNLADAYLAAGQPDRSSEVAREVLGRQRQSPLADRGRLMLARALEAAGRFDAALDVLHDATLTWRMPETFATARSEERRVAKRLGKSVFPFTADEYFTVAARLTSTSHFEDAVVLLDEGARSGQVPPGEPLEWATIENLYEGRQNEAAAKRCAQFLSRFPDGRLAPDVRLTQVRLDVRLGDVAQARRRVASMQADHSVPASLQLSAARLVAAQLVATGEVRQGLAMYKALLRGRPSRSDRFDVAWRAGVAAIRANDFRYAVSALRQARKSAPGRGTPRSTIYWLAFALDRSGSRAEARRLWSDLVAENAYDYYGLRAAERLPRGGGLVTTAARSDFPSLEITAAAEASAEFRAAMVLARAGLVDDTASLLRVAVARFRTDDGLALLAARASFSAGDFGPAWSIVSARFASYLARPAEGMPPDLWQMAFPRAYWDDVQPAAARAGVDPLLLLSLMRRESRFVLTARSRAGAIGLFQVMPETAREVAAAPAEAADDEQLLAAPASAEVAARLVKRIATRFGNATAPIVASYNAGEARVEAWWQAAHGLGEDLFVDSIPYGETRQYVREVLANYATYKRLYADKRSFEI